MRIRIDYLKSTDSLHKILELSFDAESSYEELKNNTYNRDLVDWLNKKQELTTDFIMQILTLLQHYEIPPKSHYTLKSKFCKIWLDAKLRFLKFSDALIIRECNKMDALMLGALSRQIELGGVTKEIQKMYGSYKNRLRCVLQPREDQRAYTI